MHAGMIDTNSWAWASAQMTVDGGLLRWLVAHGFEQACPAVAGCTGWRDVRNHHGERLCARDGMGRLLDRRHRQQQRADRADHGWSGPLYVRRMSPDGADQALAIDESIHLSVPIYRPSGV